VVVNVIGDELDPVAVAAFVQELRLMVEKVLDLRSKEEAIDRLFSRLLSRINCHVALP
jgi:hypothetical protein